MLDGFQFPKTIFAWCEAHQGTAMWTQAVVAGVAIIAVYVAATIPVRAEARRQKAERKLRADGLALLLYPEIIALKGEMEKAIESGDIYDTPIVVPATLVVKTGDLYVLEETGRRILQTIGLVNGIAAQTRSFQRVGMVNGVSIMSMVADGEAIWANHVSSMQMGVHNLDAVVKDLQTFIIE
jgi:hypothetical protein